jgi:hypothetical protein
VATSRRILIVALVIGAGTALLLWYSSAQLARDNQLRVVASIAAGDTATLRFTTPGPYLVDAEGTSEAIAVVARRPVAVRDSARGAIVVAVASTSLRARPADGRHHLAQRVFTLAIPAAGTWYLQPGPDTVAAIEGARVVIRRAPGREVVAGGVRALFLVTVLLASLLVAGIAAGREAVQRG